MPIRRKNPCAFSFAPTPPAKESICKPIARISSSRYARIGKVRKFSVYEQAVGMAHATSLNPNTNLIRTGILQRPANFSEHSRFGNFDCSLCSFHCCPLDRTTFSLGCELFQVIRWGVPSERPRGPGPSVRDFVHSELFHGGCGRHWR